MAAPTITAGTKITFVRSVRGVQVEYSAVVTADRGNRVVVSGAPVGLVYKTSIRTIG